MNATKLSTDAKHESNLIGTASLIADESLQTRGIETSLGTQEAFLEKKVVALRQLHAMRESINRNPQCQHTQADSKCEHSQLLSPISRRPDLRREQSMSSFHRLGFVATTKSFTEYWEKFLQTALRLFESRVALMRALARVRSSLPHIPETTAFCAVAENLGDTDEAIERLMDARYERELSYVASVVDVPKLIQLHFRSSSAGCVSMLPLPARNPAEIEKLIAHAMKTELSPSYKAGPRGSGATPTRREPRRLDDMIAAHANAQRALNTRTDGQKPHEAFAMITDFREFNAAIQHAMLPI